MESSVGANGAAPALVPHEAAGSPLWSSPSPLPAPQAARASVTIAIPPRTNCPSNALLLDRNIRADLPCRAVSSRSAEGTSNIAVNVEIEIIQPEICQVLCGHLRSRRRVREIVS